MTNTVTTNHALRIMGVWMRRADALLSHGAVANAAYAVNDERRRVARTERELAALDLCAQPLPLAG